MRHHNKSSRKTAGHFTRRDSKANQPPKDTAWMWFTQEMLESPAWRSLSGPTHRGFYRICLEHMIQGGRENGRLKVTQQNFRDWGLGGRQIGEAIEELELAGFIVRTFFGRQWQGEDKGAPQQFRLTWLPVFEPDNVIPPTNEWKSFDPAVKQRRLPRLHTLKRQGGSRI